MKCFVAGKEERIMYKLNEFKMSKQVKKDKIYNGKSKTKRRKLLFSE